MTFQKWFHVFLCVLSLEFDCMVRKQVLETKRKACLTLYSFHTCFMKNGVLIHRSIERGICLIYRYMVVGNKTTTKIMGPGKRSTS